MDTEGRVQHAKVAVFPPGDAREDWTILRAFSQQIGKRLPFDDLHQLRRKLAEDHPVFAAVDTLQAAEWQPFGNDGEMGSTAFASPIETFYMTDPISRASITMAKCLDEIEGRAAAE